jgi:hypothetical protein
MNEMNSNSVGRLFYAVAGLGAFLLMAAAAALMVRYTEPLPAGYSRAEERRTATLNMESTGQKQLAGYEVLNAEHGQVRLPIERAMELVVQEWRDPAGAQAGLVARWERFNPPPPPPPEPPPSDYE